MQAPRVVRLPAVQLVGPAVALFCGVILLVLGLQAEAFLNVVMGMGLEDEQVGAVRLIVLMVGYGLGVGLVSGSLVGFFRVLTDREVLYVPYVDALTPVAAEYGRRVETHPQDGLGFVSRAEGVRLEVLVQPARPPFISVWMRAPGQQRLLFVPDSSEGHDADDAEEADWRLVGRRGNWALRAEMPSVARPLLNEGALVDDIVALMRHREARAIKHDQHGIEVLLDLVSPIDLRTVVGDAVRVCRRLRQVNG